MNIRSKKGFVLAIALYFIILTLIISIAMYANAFYVTKESGITETASTREYYVAVGGARYAYVLLQSPTADANPTGFCFGNADMNGETSRTVDMAEPAHAQFKNDIGLQNGETMTLIAQEYDPGNPSATPWDSSSYQVTVNFTTD